MIPVKIKKIGSGWLPTRATPGAAALDLYARTRVDLSRMRRGDSVVIPCGFAVELPPGYEAQIRARSSAYGRWGVVIPNAPGTIDSDYRGEIKVQFALLGLPKSPLLAGDRIAQMVIQRVPEIELVEAQDLSETKRGSGGFGSTGTEASDE